MLGRGGNIYNNVEIIISLSEENKQLKETIETLKETNKLLLQQKGQLQDDLDNYSNRIDKAIEYIEIPDNLNNAYDRVSKETVDELLEILKGENNE